MNTFADALTGGIIAGTIASIVIFLICLGAAVFAFKWVGNHRGDFDAGVIRGVGIFATLGAVATVGIYIWASWPLAYDYHHWVDKRGRVVQISKRLVPAGDSSMEQKFVVRLADGEQLGILDTRAALLKPGDVIHLRCKKAYQYGVPRSAHGWDCQWD